MRALFLRLLAAILGVWLVVQGVFAAWASLAAGDRGREERDALVRDQLQLVAERLEGRRGHERRHALEQVRRGLRMPIDLLPPESRPRAPHVVLRDGDVLVADPARVLPPPLSVLALQAALGALTLGALLGWVSRPLRAGLDALERTSNQLAEGDLAARTGLVDGPVGEVAARFDHMAERLEALVEGQRDLLAAVSHELRTPMTRLRFRLESASDVLDPREREAVDAELDAMDRLLGELLDLARLEQAPREHPEPDATRELIDDLVRRAEPVASARGLAVTARCEGGLPMSRPDQARVVGNLLTNALRHARSAVTVTVQGARLVVDDDGPGVPQADRARVFEPFHTGDPSRSRETGGVGLGLTLVSRAVARWGGTVHVETRPGGGARFVVEFN